MSSKMPASGRSRPTWANISSSLPGSGRSTSSRPPCTSRPKKSAGLFHEKLGEPYSAEHAALTAIARKHLRADYLAAGMGISGCNFAVADSGTVVVVENEGNAGLSTATPPVHVVLVGIEKLIPKLDHLPLFLNLLGRSGTGQKLTTYTHLIRGPAAGQEDVRDLPGQRPDEGPARPACLAVVVLHSLRGMPERLPGLPPRGRLVVWLGISGADRLGAHAAPRRPGKGGQAAVRFLALWGMRRSMPREDRHSPPTGPSPPSRGERAFAHELGLRAVPMEALGLGDGRAAALRPGNVGGSPRRADGKIPALAPGQARRWTRGRELPKVPSHSFRSWWQQRGNGSQSQKGKP